MCLQALVPRLLLPMLCLFAWPAAAQSLGVQTHLAFGAFVVSGAGTVTVQAAGGRSQTGGAVLVNQGGSATPAIYAITGAPFAVYSVSLPEDDSVVLSDGQGHTLQIESFSSQPASSGTLGAGGTGQINVGATLAVGAGQAKGAYSGSFQITLNYQ